MALGSNFIAMHKQFLSLRATAFILCAFAHLGAGAMESTAETNACRAEVLKFEEAIGFVRQAQGNTAASAMREKLLPAKVEADILFSQGYCGIAKYLREKKLTR
jgi:hypothetical protein